MTALVDRIVAIIEEHLVCECGSWAEDVHENCAHVAERIAAELQPEQDRQLTEAWQAGFNEGMKRR